MAYLKDLDRVCDELGCARRATKALYSTRNAEMGRYCAKCAARALRRLQGREDANGR